MSKYAGNAPASMVYLPSAARTTLQNGQVLKNWRGVHFIIVVTADPSAASITPTVEGYDEASGTWIALLTGAAIAATGTTVLGVGPHVPTATNVGRQMPLPHQFRLSMAVGNADSMTYSIGAWLEP